MSQDQLPLRDIHLPDGVSWWPPAPGYWIVLSLLILLLVLAFMFRRWRQRQKRKQTILTVFTSLESDYIKNRDPLQLVQALSVFLRRVSLQYFPASGCESLTGRQWLAFLDSKRTDSTDFQTGPGQVLADGPYKKDIEVDAERLLAICKDWLSSVLSNRREST